MCVAIPGKVVSIDGDKAVVDFNGNRVNALMGATECCIGDSVLVHAGCIIQKVSENEADEMNDIFNELADIMGG